MLEYYGRHGEIVLDPLLACNIHVTQGKFGPEQGRESVWRVQNNGWGRKGTDSQ